MDLELTSSKQFHTLHHPRAARNEVYITNKHPIVVYHRRIESLLTDLKTPIIVLYAAGKAIQSALKILQDLSLEFKNSFTYEMESGLTTGYATQYDDVSIQEFSCPVPCICIKINNKLTI